MRGVLQHGVVVAWAGFLVAGCPTTAEDFDCTEDSQCTLDAVMGWCEPNRWCSFPAPECPSGRRYGDQAGQGLAGQCVSDGGSTSTQGDPSSSGVTSTTPDPAPTSSTTLPEETTTGASTSGSSDSSSSTGTIAETSGSSSSTGGPGDGFFDDFDRPDSDDIGNGWIERTPGVWALQADRVSFAGQAENFQDSTFYRPFDEALLDLETSVEFTFIAEVNSSTPQLHARIREDTLAQPGLTNAYLAYMPDGDQLVLTRVDGDVFGLSESVPVNPPIEVGERYRLMLRVEGIDPVELFGSVERFDPNLDDWSVVQTVTMTDAENERIVDPGSFGSSGSYNVVFTYDNFSMTPL